MGLLAGELLLALRLTILNGQLLLDCSLILGFFTLTWGEIHE